jgi:carboxyl-terminal processing protease
VYDGGRFNLILPFTKRTSQSQCVQQNDGIFNYATKFTVTKPNTWKIPVISDADYADFKNYLKAQNSPDTETELF